MTSTGTFLAPETFYRNNVAKVKAIFHSNDTARVINAISGDFELVAFLVLSPAHLLKLEDTLRKELNFTATLMASTDASFETIAVLQTALDGFKYHFGTTTLEKGWFSMMTHIHDCLEESSSSAATALQEQVQKVGSLLLSGKNRIESCELSVLRLTARDFKIEYGLKGSYFIEHCDLPLHLKQKLCGTTPKEFSWAKSKERPLFTIPKSMKFTPESFIVFFARVIPFMRNIIHTVSLMYWSCVAVVNLPTVMSFLFRRQFTKYVAASFTKRSLYFLIISIVAVLWIVRTHINQKAKISLQ
nr:P3 protein [Oat mosaic virus]